MQGKIKKSSVFYKILKSDYDCNRKFSDKTQGTRQKFEKWSIPDHFLIHAFFPTRNTLGQ